MWTPTPGLLVSADEHFAEPNNIEEYAQKYGQVIHFPTLRDRITYQTGELFIKVGEKMTETSLKHVHLDGKMA